MQMKQNLFRLLSHMSENQLQEVYPVIYQELRKAFYGDEIPILETDLTEEELSLLNESILEYEKDPSGAMSLEELLKEEYCGSK